MVTSVGLLISRGPLIFTGDFALAPASVSNLSGLVHLDLPRFVRGGGIGIGADISGLTLVLLEETNDGNFDGKKEMLDRGHLGLENLSNLHSLETEIVFTEGSFTLNLFGIEGSGGNWGKFRFRLWIRDLSL